MIIDQFVFKNPFEQKTICFFQQHSSLWKYFKKFTTIGNNKSRTKHSGGYVWTHLKYLEIGCVLLFQLLTVIRCKPMTKPRRYQGVAFKPLTFFAEIDMSLSPLTTTTTTTTTAIIQIVQMILGNWVCAPLQCVFIQFKIEYLLIPPWEIPQVQMRLYHWVYYPF